MNIPGPVTSDLHRYCQTRGFHLCQFNHLEASRQGLQSLPLLSLSLPLLPLVPLVPHQQRNANHCGHIPFQQSHLRFLSSALI